jgi:hypothetical protein
MLRVSCCALAAALTTLTLSGCRDSVGPPRRAPALSSAQTVVSTPRSLFEPRIIPANATDPDINYEKNLQNAEHYVWLNRSVRVNPRLLVFLPGTSNRPIDHQLIEQDAASLGYHVIGLMYQSNVGVDAICKGSSDMNCSGDLRLEVLTGLDISRRVVVTPANGIDNRLTKLLVHLSDETKYPGEQWASFLEPGDGGVPTPKWEQIVVAGYSQGAGQAALIGKLRLVERVVMLSGPVDSRVFNLVDPWIALGKTSAEKYFALFHEREGASAAIDTNLTVLGLMGFGEPVRVTSASGEPACCNSGTHVVVSSLTPHVLDSDLPAHSDPFDAPYPHRSTARDFFTPLDAERNPQLCYWLDAGNAQRIDGVPKLRDAWRYLLGGGPPSGSGCADNLIAAR